MKRGDFTGLYAKLVAGLLAAIGIMCVMTPNVYAEGEIGNAAQLSEKESFEGYDGGSGISFDGDIDDLSYVPDEDGEFDDDEGSVDGYEVYDDAKEVFATTGTGGFVARMYRIVLGREPEQGGYDYWVAKLNNKELGAADIVTEFFGSEEYKNKHKSNAAVVRDFYAAMLERTPDADGLSYWVRRLNVGMTEQAIAAGFVGSTEFAGICGRYGMDPGTVTLKYARDQNYERTYFVYRLYNNCLGRQPETDGLEHWCAKIAEGESGAEIAQGFVFSTEFKRFHTENEDFVKMLYRTILAREAEGQGYTYWVDLLDYTTTRERVFNGFLFSEEFAGQCQVAGINVGNAIYEPDDTDTWRMNIDVLTLCNRERQAAGLSRLKTKEWLWEEVAMVRADEITGYFSHTRPDGRSCWTAYTDAGINYGYSAENIAAGYQDAYAVVNGWMNSSGHRSNILGGSEYLATGLAYDGGRRKYYSQNFMYGSNNWW